VERAVGAPLGAAPVALYAALIDAVEEIRPFQDALAALTEATPPAVVASAARKDRRVLPGREPQDDAALVVGADGAPLPAGVPARWLPYRGRGIWSWCERHARWHRLLSAIIRQHDGVACVAIARISGSCDEYRARLRTFHQALPMLTLDARPEPVQLWYRQWPGR